MLTSLVSLLTAVRNRLSTSDTGLHSVACSAQSLRHSGEQKSSLKHIGHVVALHSGLEHFLHIRSAILPVICIRVVLLVC